MTEPCAPCAIRLKNGERLPVRRSAIRTGATRIAVALLTGAGLARAQDTSRTQGVRIGLTYTANTRPGVVITPVSGTAADSVREMLHRDLDNGDRVNAIVPAGGDVPTGALNYPMYAQMGAVAVVQASVTGAGSLHIAVHEVASAGVV